MTCISMRPVPPAIVLLMVWLAIERSQAQTPALPVIPANSFDVTNYGAIGDGVTTNTTAIQNTINAASLAGGGTVEIPEGTYLSGPLNLSNSINMQIDGGAILRMLPYGQYPGGASPADFITTASGLHDLEVSGAGVIDGQAENSGWWTNNLSTSERPTLFYFNKCNRVLIQNVTLENSPSMHIVFKNGGGNITVQGITINTSGSSPNTDGIDLIGTNCLVQNCSISDGDDCIALGSTSATSSGTLVTNCSFGFGHGLSIGSNTAGGVSNLTVINCSFNGTEYGIRMKSDDNSSSPGEGGVAQNLFYYNLQMTNITESPLVIYSYYNEYGTPIGITPATAAAQPIPSPVPSTTPVWQNIVISNMTATVTSGGIAGIIWGRTELPATNVLLSQVNITAPGSFDVYNANGFQFANSQLSLSGNNTAFVIYNAGMILTNDSGKTITFAGLTSSNCIALYNSSASTTATDIFGADPITLSAGTLVISNKLTLPNATSFNFALGTNASTVTANGNLALDGASINVTNAGGFGPDIYTLFAYSGALSGSLALGSAPTNFNYAFYTNNVGQVQLLVSRIGLSLSSVTLLAQASGGTLQLSWPADHTGWYLESQTNLLSTNWTILFGSQNNNEFSVPVNPAAKSLFLRLFYP